ncbi:MAG: TolC family protein [Planctomycetota bacterium]
MSKTHHQRGLTLLCAGFAVLVGSVVGCRSPFAQERADEILRQSVRRSIDRELEQLTAEGATRETFAEPSEVERELAERRQELDEISPAMPGDPRAPLQRDLEGQPQDEMVLNLESAITAAVSHNLGIQQSRLLPAIREADVVAAEAVFDVLLYANASLSRIDEPTAVPTLMGIPLGQAVQRSQTDVWETGVRKLLTTGGEVTLSTDFTRFDARGLTTFAPDPAYTSAFRLRYTQPLLRGAGADVNTATIRLSRNEERRSIQDVRVELLNLIADTETAYWQLVFSWQNLAIQVWLVEVGEEVARQLELRQEYDTLPAEFADAIATVEQRKADVIRARRAIRSSSDTLKVLLNDPALPIGGETVLVPADALIEAPITFSLRESLITAMQNRPEVQQAILNIDDATIRQALADNSRLPVLNASAELGYIGLADSPGGAYENALDDSFIDWIIGLAFEMPIGNREAEARYRQARLQRTSSVIAYRQTIQQIILDVKSALRDVVTNYELIQATRSFRIAQAENLRQLEIEQSTIGDLRPESLNLKFQRQETLAFARQEELQALVNFDSAIANLYRATGIGLEMNNINVEIISAPADANANDR